MTAASDNIFPKLILVEGAAPASPAASDFKLYVDSSDHLLKMKNSAGTVTTFGTGLVDPMTTRGDIIIRDSSNSTARLAIGSAGTVLSSDGTDVSWQAASGGALAANGTRQTSGADYTTSSTSFGDIDGTNLSVSITTGAHRVKVTFNAFMSVGSASNFCGIDVLVDGTGVGSNGVWVVRPNNNGFTSVSLVYMTAALTAASHTIKLQWKVDGNTATIQRTTAPCVFLVEELPF